MDQLCRSCCKSDSHSCGLSLTIAMSATSKRLKSQACQQLTSTSKSIAKSTSPVKFSTATGQQKAVTGPTKLPMTPNKHTRSPPAAKTKPALSAGAASRLPRPAASKPALPGTTKRRLPAGSTPVRCSTKLLPTDVPAAPQAVDIAPAADQCSVDNPPPKEQRLVSPPELPSLQDLRRKLQVSRQSLLGKAILCAAFVSEM